RTGAPVGAKGFPVFAVRRFTEKPELKLAQEYLATGNYHWNAGMFFWRVSAFLENLGSFLPKTHAALEKLADFIGTRNYERQLRAIYAQLENISVDYAVLEPATRAEGPPRVFVIPAEVGWAIFAPGPPVMDLWQRRGARTALADKAARLMRKAIFF